MTVRSLKERIVQTGCFELIGIAFVSPIYAYFTGASMVHGVAMIAMLSVVIMVWCPIFNTIFDLIERARTTRLACKRPHAMRMLHAALHEITAVMITCPLLMLVGGHSLGSALALNVGLTLTYTVYTYFFHIIYDRIRPVQPYHCKEGQSAESSYAYDLKEPPLLLCDALNTGHNCGQLMQCRLLQPNTVCPKNYAPSDAIRVSEPV